MSGDIRIQFAFRFKRDTIVFVWHVVASPTDALVVVLVGDGGVIILYQFLF
jgi:hypothetical protein